MYARNSRGEETEGSRKRIGNVRKEFESEVNLHATLDLSRTNSSAYFSESGDELAEIPDDEEERMYSHKPREHGKQVSGTVARTLLHESYFEDTNDLLQEEEEEEAVLREENLQQNELGDEGASISTRITTVLRRIKEPWEKEERGRGAAAELLAEHEKARPLPTRKGSGRASEEQVRLLKSGINYRSVTEIEPGAGVVSSKEVFLGPG